jgi:hypothetical protein
MEIRRCVLPKEIDIKNMSNLTSILECGNDD